MAGNVFWETHHNGGFLSVAVWRGQWWCGYLGRIDQEPIDIDPHVHGDQTGSINTAEYPEIGIAIMAPGFDTIHRGDSNTGPNGERGMHMAVSHQNSKEWNKEAVFEHLRWVTDQILAN